MRLYLLPLLILTFFTTADISSASNKISSQYENATDLLNDTISFGQNNLFALIEMQGGYNGTILVLDGPNTEHERAMVFSIVRLVPNQHVITAEVGIAAGPGDGPRLQEKMKMHSVRVLHDPTLYYLLTNAESPGLQTLENADALSVVPVPNITTIPSHDIFQPENPFWGGTEEADGPAYTPAKVRNDYQNVEEYFQSGRAILATYAMEKPANFSEYWNLFSYIETMNKTGGEEKVYEIYQNAKEYVRYPGIARIGGLKEYGFSILLKKKSIPSLNGTTASPSGSYASAHLSAFAFYLFQLWDTTAEVVEVMQKTAIDIGEPGPDEEFGWGLINADHPIIWNRAIEKLQQSLSFCLLEDVAFEEAVTATSKNKGFDIFHDIRSNKREIGLTYNKGKTTLALATGSAQGLFGLRSRFLQQRSPFMQIGLRHSLISNVSFVGVFGQSEQEDFSVRKGSLGIHYRSNIAEKGNLSLYAGYRIIRGNIGLPGHTVMGIAQVPFALNIPEVRASFNWSF